MSLIILDFVIRANRRFYPQTLLEECKYEVTRDKVENLINDDLDLSSSNLIVNLIMYLIMDPIISLLKVKTVF